MTDLGVEINLSKTLKSSKGVAEFAKRLVGPQGDLSPISPRLIVNTGLDVRFAVSLVRDALSRGALTQALATDDSQTTESLVRDFVDKLPNKSRLPGKFIWNFIGPLGFITGKDLSPFLENKMLSPEQLGLIATATDRVVNRNLAKGYFTDHEKLSYSTQYMLYGPTVATSLGPTVFNVVAPKHQIWHLCSDMPSFMELTYSMCQSLKYLPKRRPTLRD
jgi:hypothetical protein